MNTPAKIMEFGLDTRRKFLDWMIAIFGFIAAIGVIYPVGAFLWPPKQKTDYIGKRSMKLPLTWIPVGEVKLIRFLNKPTLLIRPNEQELWALSAICTHLGCVVKYSESMNMFHCPCHAGRFDIRGNVVSGPPPSPLDRYTTKLENEYVVIEEV